MWDLEVLMDWLGSDRRLGLATGANGRISGMFANRRANLISKEEFERSDVGANLVYIPFIS